MSQPVNIRYFPSVDYQSCWDAMRDFTAQRTQHTTDELWVLEHPPVFTLGRAGKPEHLLAPGDIPVVHCDRGGQVTCHAPGQTVVYLLIDIKRLGVGSKNFVHGIEAAVIDTLEQVGLTTHSDPDAPGVYAGQRKIASLGLRIRRGRSYHGLAINRDMDLSLWQRINPCGYEGQAVTNITAEGVEISRASLENKLVDQLAMQLDMTPHTSQAPKSQGL